MPQLPSIFSHPSGAADKAQEIVGPFPRLGPVAIGHDSSMVVRKSRPTKCLFTGISFRPLIAVNGGSMLPIFSHPAGGVEMAQEIGGSLPLLGSE